MRLVVFDVDGTLVDSQHTIMSAMTSAFSGLGLAPPPRPEVLSIVGLSLPLAMARLAPDAAPQAIDGLVEGYKAAFFAEREAGGTGSVPPLYPGARAALEALAARDDVLMGIATGKSRRGLDHLLDVHDLGSFFIATECADHHPSKPHPAMLEAVLDAAGVMPDDAVMLGDTTFDIEMARAARVAGIGVAWGYHSEAALLASGAQTVLQEFRALLPHLRKTEFLG